MNGEGIMGLPPGMGAGMGMPEGGIGEFDSLVQAQQITKDVGVNRVIKELLSAGADIDPYEIKQFLEEIRSTGMTADDREAIREVVTRVKADPNNYTSVRQQLLSEGAPEDLLPETFDPEFFIALELAIEAESSMGSAPQTPVQNFAQGGIAELPQMQAVAAEIARMGRNGDSMLAHITPQEAMMLRREGGSGTINPYTGLPEFFLKKVFKAVKNTVKRVTNVVKKFAKSTVGRIVIGVAAGMILGPAAIGFLQGATGVALSAAATTGITAATGAFVSGMAAGDGFKNSLKSAVLVGATAYGGSALMGGSAAMATPAAGTGPQSFSEGLSQGWDSAKSAVNNMLGTEKTIQPSAAEMDRLQQEAAIRQQSPGTAIDYLQSGEALAAETVPGTPVSAGSAGRLEAPIAPATAPATSPLNITREAEGFTPSAGTPSSQLPLGRAPQLELGRAPQAALTSPSPVSAASIPPYEMPPSFLDAQQQAQAIQQARAASATGAAPSTSLGSPGILDRAKAFYQSPSFDSFSDVFIDPNARTALGKYGPLAVAGLGATAAMGGFKSPPTDPQPLGFDPITGLRPGERPFREQRPDLFGEDRQLSSPDFSLGQTLVQSPRYSTMAVSDVPVYRAPSMSFQSEGVRQPYNVSGMYGIPGLYRASEGSSPEGVTNFPRKTGPINGPGTGTSDSIPAMLSDGEFVFTAKAVRNMGNGSRRKGAARMYKMMKMLEGGPVSSAAKKG